jgi:hypothetical protein
MSTQLDALDAIATRVAKDDLDCYGPLSTGERLYVALAASRTDLLERDSYTIAEALARIGEGWTAELVRRWQYRGNPKNFVDEETGA